MAVQQHRLGQYRAVPTSTLSPCTSLSLAAPKTHRLSTLCRKPLSQYAQADGQYTRRQIASIRVGR
eukprot:1172577-Rhodomonas_salina.1